MYASHFNWLQVSFRRTSLSSTGFESRKGERFLRAQGRRYLPVSASILLYFESLILNPTLRAWHYPARRLGPLVMSGLFRNKPPTVTLNALAASAIARASAGSSSV